jgi:hypothetical protein
MRIAFATLISAAGLFAAETPFDLIRPVYPMEWSTAAVEEGGTVYDFANFTVNEKDTLVGTPKSGAKPADFKANAYIADTLNQAFIDALNLKVSNIRVNQAGYLPDDPEKQFYYVSDKCESATYSVVDLEGEEVAAGGKFSAFGKIDQTARVVKAYVNSLDKRYTVEKTAPEAKVCAGKLAELATLPTDKRLRIKVGKEYSSTFIVSDKVYSMVRDANLKFFGVQRSGDSESWFHKASHVHDTIPGGWYDCGDHLKMAPTMGYAFMMLSLLSATNPERDEDHYAFNHNEIVKTDGIPDMLREARHGAEFYLRSYEYAKGEIKDMIVNIGDATDHNYWNRADSMESMNPVPPRPVMHGIGPGMSAQVAAGLALLSVRYATYDKAFADSCLKVAEKLYAYAKEHFGEEEYCLAGFYACTINSKHIDVFALAAIALHYATYEKTKKMDYLNDAAKDKTINDNINAEYRYEYFPAGWLGYMNGFEAGGWPSDYQNRFAITLYAFYKLLLADEATAEKFGIEDTLRLDYIKRVVYSLAQGAEDGLMVTSGSKQVDMLEGHRLEYSTPWYVTVSFNWGANHYDSGNIINMLTYAEVVKDVSSKKIFGGSDSWKYRDVRQLAINKMNYILGVNQWDICFMTGVGDKNEAHVHHRTSNPEGWNGMTVDEYFNYKDFLASYSYRPPVGALMGGSMNDSLISDWEIYTATETAIYGNASFLAANVLLAAAVTAVDTTKKDTTKTDSTKTDTTKTDSTKTDSTKKEGIAVAPAIESFSLDIAHHGNFLDVNYVLPQAADVKISLVSIKGTAVKQFTGRQGAGGHNLQWDVAQIPAGTYLVAVRTGSTRDYRIVKIGL